VILLYQELHSKRTRRLKPADFEDIELSFAVPANESEVFFFYLSLEVYQRNQFSLCVVTGLGSDGKNFTF